VVKTLVLLAFVALLLYLLLFPGKIPGLLRRLGRAAGDVRRAGEELATGEEVERSPLARYEARAGELVAIKVLSAHPRSSDDALQRLVADLGQRIAAGARRREIDYRFTAVESDAPNAFAVPGGSIFITRPLIDLCDGDPHRIAGVLGHELIHIDRRHAIRSLAATMAVRAGFRVVPLARGIILSRLAGGMESLLAQGYRQDQELEADLLGSRVARLAGFDPRGLIALLERVRAAAPGPEGALAEVLQYFQSHPPIALRIEKLRQEWR
jgi:predicted Zn-dependent protease